MAKKLQYNWETGAKIGGTAVVGAVAASFVRDKVYAYITETAVKQPDHFLVKQPWIVNAGLTIIGLFVPPLFADDKEYSDYAYAFGAGIAAVGGQGLFRYLTTPKEERGAGLYGAIGKKKGYYMRRIGETNIADTTIAGRRGLGETNLDQTAVMGTRGRSYRMTG